MSNQPSKKNLGIKGLIVKFFSKFLTFLPKILKATKLIKFGLAAATLATYSMLFTWKFAILIMIAIGWHESGHVWAMRKLGFKTKGFWYLPLLGGVAIQADAYKTYAQNVFVAIMGPVWGLALTLLSCALYYSTGLPLFAAAAGWMAFINLFNLFPVNPLDGGQIVRSTAFSIGRRTGLTFLFGSLVLGTYLMFKMHVGLFAIILVIGILDLFVELIVNKRNNNFHAKWAKEYRSMAEKLRSKINSATSKIMCTFYERNAEGYEKCAEEYESQILSGPKAMNKTEIALSFISYAITTIVLISIIKLMAQVPGAELAATFLAS